MVGDIGHGGHNVSDNGWQRCCCGVAAGANAFHMRDLVDLYARMLLFNTMHISVQLLLQDKQSLHPTSYRSGPRRDACNKANIMTD